MTKKEKMRNNEIERKTFRKTRKDVIEENLLDRKPICPAEDLNVVLRDWKKIRTNLKQISIDVSQKFFTHNPFYKTLFPAFAEVSSGDLPNNEYFVMHSYAILKGIDSIMMNFSAEYEEENEILPVISITHLKRGVPLKIMHRFKDCLATECCRFLESKQKEKASWETVINCIFDSYLLRAYPKLRKSTSDENYEFLLST